MKRAPYVGDAGVLGGGGQPAIPLQPETIAYLNRFSGTVSQAYKSALNQAIFRWKAAGVYSLLQDFWLTCADTQADSLRNLISASRDATITGAPTFTALRGFSGFGASNYVGMPFSATGLAHTSGFMFAGQFDPSIGGSVLLMGDSLSVAGAVGSTQTGSYIGIGVLPGAAPMLYAAAGTSRTSTAVVGCVNIQWVSPFDATAPNGSSIALTSSPLKADKSPLLRLNAYALMPSATAAQVRKFLSILTAFLEDIGAIT